MEMLQLRYFYDSAMAQSFSKTAQKYMVPVSSVSASVKRLEQELGVELFTRMGNRILLNEKGRQFLSVVSNTLSQLDMGVSALSANPTKKQTISVLARCTRKTIVRQIMTFHKLYPSVFFKLTFDDAPENFGNYDIVISAPNEVLNGYDYFYWREFRVCIEALETDPLCRGPVTLNQLRDRLFITTNSQKEYFKAFTQACKRKGFTPKLFLECDDYVCRNIALLSGACLGLNLGNTDTSGLPNVCYLKVTDFDERIISNIYYKKENYEGNIKLFLDLLKSTAP